MDFAESYIIDDVGLGLRLSEISKHLSEIATITAIRDEIPLIIESVIRSLTLNSSYRLKDRSEVSSIISIWDKKSNSKSRVL